MIATGLFVIALITIKGNSANAIYYMCGSGKSMTVTYLCDCVNGNERQLSCSLILQLYNRNNHLKSIGTRTPCRTVGDMSATYERVAAWAVERYVTT